MPIICCEANQADTQCLNIIRSISGLTPSQTVALVVTYLADKKLIVIRTVCGLHVLSPASRIGEGEIGLGVVVVNWKTALPRSVST